MESALPSKAFHCGSWASVVSASAGSTTPSDVVLQSTLAAQAKQLHGLLVQVGSVLERAEAALSKLSLVPAMLQTTPMPRPPGEADVGSAEGRGAELYGCFSPLMLGIVPCRCLT